MVLASLPDGNSEFLGHKQSRICRLGTQGHAHSIADYLVYAANAIKAAVEAFDANGKAASVLYAMGAKHATLPLIFSVTLSRIGLTTNIAHALVQPNNANPPPLPLSQHRWIHWV